MSQSQENLQTDGSTNRRMVGQTLFYSALPAETGGPTRYKHDTLYNVYQAYPTIIPIFAIKLLVK